MPTPSVALRAHVTRGKVSISSAGLRYVLLPSERRLKPTGSKPSSDRPKTPKRKCLGVGGITGIGNVSWV